MSSPEEITKAEFLEGYSSGIITEVVNLYPAQNWIVGKQAKTKTQPKPRVVYWEYTP